MIKFEVINIPWTDQLVNYTSDVFRNAKYIVEEAVSILQPKSIKYIFEYLYYFCLAGFGLH